MITVHQSSVCIYMLCCAECMLERSAVFSAACQSCVTGVECCGTFQTICNAYCETVDECCYMEEDEECIAANAECDEMIASFDGPIAAQEAVILDAISELDLTEDELYAAEVSVNQTSQALATAYLSLGILENSTDVEVMARRFIEANGSALLIQIREISFNVPLPLAQRGTFKASVTASVRGQPYSTFRFDIDLRAFTSMVHRMSNVIFPGISSFGETNRQKRSSGWQGNQQASTVQR